MRKVKRKTFLLTCLFIVFVLVNNSFGIPASPYLYELTQPDGTTFIGKMWGDEFCHGWETIDGYTIVLNEDNGYWEYAVLSDDGSLKPSSIIVGIDGETPLPESKGLKPTKKIYYRGIPSSALRRSMEGKAVTGEGRLPVVLMNFADTTPTYSRSSFTNSWFGSNGRTLKKYYEEVSGGRFTVSPGSAGIRGWYTASKGHDYYGENREGIDYRIGELIREAAEHADKDMDFTEYDQDGDGEVDIFVVVFQGTGEHETGDEYDIWPHQASLEVLGKHNLPGGGKYMTQDGVYINSYLVVNELGLSGMCPIGVIAHEYGHALGLPDLYDTDYSSIGVGYWSLMGSGSYGEINYPGDCPTHLDAWSKYFLGWITPTEVGLGFSQTVTFLPVEAGGDVYKIGVGGPLSGEYFLVENRQNVGFDTALPGSGLLIWHVDGDYISKKLERNRVNDKECVMEKWDKGILCCLGVHYGVSLKQADGKFDLEYKRNEGDDGDPYPGISENDAFTEDTIPGSLLYGCKGSGLSITGIRVVSDKNLEAKIVYENPTSLEEPNSENGEDDIGCGKLHRTKEKNENYRSKFLLDISISGIVLISLTGLVKRKDIKE